MRILKHILYLILANAIFVAIVEKLIGWITIWSAWRKLTPASVAWGLTLLSASYLCRASRIHWYFYHRTAGNFLCSLKLTLAHNFLNNVVPFRGGEASFPILLKSYFDISIVTGAAVLMWFRSLDLITMLSIGGMLLMTYRCSDVQLQVIDVVLWLLPFGLLILRPRLLSWLRKWPDSRVTKLFCQVLDGLPTTFRRIANDSAWTILNWLLKVTASAILLASLANVSIEVAAIGAIAGELASLMPIHAPASFGVYEGGVIAGLSIGGLPRADALISAITVHLVLLTSAFVGGVPALLVTRRKQTFSNTSIPE